MYKIIEVETTEEYFKFFNKSFAGKIIKRSCKDSDLVCVQKECGEYHWINAAWLKLKEK